MRINLYLDMALDKTLRKILEHELEKSLDALKTDSSNLTDIWNCHDSVDFHYGWHMGKVYDFCINQFFVRNGCAPSEKDLDEIKGILILHSKDVQDVLKYSKPLIPTYSI